MNDAELYQQSNSLQKRDTLECLEEFSRRIQWKHGERIIDIGCGDGSVTVEVLKNYVPSYIERLVGVDVSEKMVTFANQHYGDGRTQFAVMNVEGDIPDEVRGQFHHAFSFYVLHWVKQQERGFRNIYSLLTEGGECLLIFLGHMPAFDVYRALARRNKWSEYLKEVDKFVSPYHDSQAPDKEIRSMMEGIGFRDVDVKCLDKSYVYDSIEAAKKAVKAVNPFGLSNDLLDEFMDDYMKVVENMRLIDRVNNNLTEKLKVKTNYTLIVAFGRK